MAEGVDQFEKLLTESRDLVCARLTEALRAMLDKAEEALAGYSSETQNRDQQKLYQDARKVVVAQSATLEREFNKFYLKEFRFRANAAKSIEQSFGELEQSSLQLVGEDDLEETLRFKELAARVRKYCDEELGALDQRIGVLLGDATLAADDNPFSPTAICDAYQQACHEMGTTLQVRSVFMKLFDDHVLDEIRSIYKAVNAILVKHGILPKIRYGVTKKEGSKPGARGEEDKGVEADAATAADAEANLFSLLQNLVAKTGGGGGAQPGQPVLNAAELMGSLTRLQQGDGSVVPDGVALSASGTTNVLHGLKASSLGAGMAQMDAMTLDIVAMMFDQLFDDPKVPIGVKGLVGRMQIPILKVGIADKSFFAKKTHPARQMLDTLGEIALRLPTDFDAGHPLFAKLETIVQQVVDGFQEDIGIFESTDVQLKSIIAEEEARVQAETRAVQEKAAQAENLAVAKTAAEDEVRSRVQTNPLPGPVLEFIVEHWLKLLLLIFVKSGSQGPQWKTALELLDQLVWSVQPKSNPDERKKLAAAVPNLVKGLAAGCKALGVAEEAREAFFGQLMKCHTDILGAAAKGRTDPSDPEMKPQPAAALDFTAPVKVKNPYGAGEVEVNGLASIDAPADVEMGSWVEFRPKDGDGERQAKKLLFVPPKRTRYIFSDRGGQDILELSRAELVRRLRSREAVRLDGEPEEPLFDRIMSGVLGKLKAPAARVA